MLHALRLRKSPHPELACPLQHQAARFRISEYPRTVKPTACDPPESLRREVEGGALLDQAEALDLEVGTSLLDYQSPGVHLACSAAPLAHNPSLLVHQNHRSAATGTGTNYVPPRSSPTGPPSRPKCTARRPSRPASRHTWPSATGPARPRAPAAGRRRAGSPCA